MWLPLPDILNLLSLIAATWFCVIGPTDGYVQPRAARLVFSVAFVLLAFHPINVAAHYRLFSKRGRSIYPERDRDYPYATGQELLTVVVTITLAAAVALALT